jgi:hypothetical protein
MKLGDGLSDYDRFIATRSVWHCHCCYLFSLSLSRQPSLFGTSKMLDSLVQVSSNGENLMSEPDEQQSGPPPAPSTASQPPATPVTLTEQTPVSGRRQAFEDVLRPLTPDDLASPGTQKIILYMLQQAQSENEQLEGYVERFHEADKRAAVLEQQYDAERKTSKVIDTLTMSGTAIGGSLFAVALYFFRKAPQPEIPSGLVFLVLSLVVFGGAIIAKLAKR